MLVHVLFASTRQYKNNVFPITQSSPYYYIEVAIGKPLIFKDAIKNASVHLVIRNETQKKNRIVTVVSAKPIDHILQRFT